MSVQQVIKEQIAQHLVELCQGSVEDWAVLLEAPRDIQHGDLALPCFRLAKELKKAPPQIAQDLAAQFPIGEAVSEVKAIGPFLNFRFNRSSYCQQVIAEHLEKDLPSLLGDQGQGQTVVIDYLSPNICKPFAVHHLRTTFIGASLARLFEAAGYQVITVNHLGDWGTQFGYVLYGYDHLLDESKDLGDDPIATLVNLYVQANAKAKEDPQVLEEARSYFHRLEQKDPRLLELWEKFRQISVSDLERLCERINIRFDHYQGEAFYEPMLDEVIAEAENKKVAVLSQGALVIPVGDDLPPMIIRKADGSTIYATRDLAAIKYRQENFNFKHNLYVVASQQNDHFKQLFRAAKALGYPQAEDCEHIPFGMVKMPGGELASTRRGNLITLDDALDQAQAQAQRVMEDSAKDLVSDEKDQTATAAVVGVGALIFATLQVRRQRDVVFAWDDVLKFTGATGPYLQYGHVRMKRIQEKAGLDQVQAGPAEHYQSEGEFQVARLLDQFPDVVARCLKEREPSSLCQYLLELVQAYNSAATVKDGGIKVLVDDEDLRRSRVAFVAAVDRVLTQGMDLLNMPYPEKM